MPINYDIYIGGAMHGRMGRAVLAERQAAHKWCEYYHLSYYDPAQDEDIHPDKIIDSRPNITCMQWYVDKDDAKLDQCRYLLVLTGDISSAGTGWEMGRMYYRNQCPIILVAPRMKSKELTNFTTIKATYITRTVDMAVKYIFDDIRRVKCLTSHLNAE